MKKIYVNVLATLLIIAVQVTGALAQTTPGFNNKLSLQLAAGTQGVGGDLRYGVNPKLSVRAGAAFIPVTVNNVMSFSGFQSANNASVKFSNLHLLADFVPFKKAQGFRLVAGAGYLYKANGGMQVLPTGTYKVGNYQLNSQDLGQLNIDVSWKGVAPYLGVGVFRSFPSKWFNVNLDLGTYYLSQPRSSIVGTKMLSDNYQLEPQLNANLKSYRWLPVAQLNFNFRIK